MNPFFTSAVVCNTGPLIGLARVGMADLPSRLFPNVIIPDEVRDELLVNESPDRAEIEVILKSVRMHPRQSKPDLLLQAELDSGEASVISAAMNLALPCVILDERKATSSQTNSRDPIPRSLPTLQAGDSLGYSWA